MATNLGELKRHKQEWAKIPTQQCEKTITVTHYMQCVFTTLAIENYRNCKCVFMTQN